MTVWQFFTGPLNEIGTVIPITVVRYSYAVLQHFFLVVKLLDLYINFITQLTSKVDRWLDLGKYWLHAHPAHVTWCADLQPGEHEYLNIVLYSFTGYSHELLGNEQFSNICSDPAVYKLLAPPVLCVTFSWTGRFEHVGKHLLLQCTLLGDQYRKNCPCSAAVSWYQ